MYGVLPAKGLASTGEEMKLDESRSQTVEDAMVKAELVLKEGLQSGRLEKISSPANGQITQTKNTIEHCNIKWGEEVLRCLHCGARIR